MRFILFYLLFFSVLSIINFYSYKRFIKKLSLHQSFVQIGRYFIYLISGLEFLYAVTFRSEGLPTVVHYLLAGSIGVGFMLFIISLLYDLILLFSSKIKLKESENRSFKLFFDIFMITVFSLYLFWGIFEGQRDPEKVFVNIKIQNWKQGPYKLIQISDLHVGNVIKKEKVKDLVTQINEESPDLVVITGDLIDKKIELIMNDLEPFKKIQSKDGVYFVLGNHEFFHEPKKIISTIVQFKIKPLLNDSIIINKNFNLVGINDPMGERLEIMPPDYAKAFKKTNKKLPSIVLAHQPKQFKEIKKYKPELILMGHTHGGQIFPFSLLVRAAQPFLAGLYIREKIKIYVNRGTGFWGPPIRVGAPSELTIFQISSEDN